MRILGVCGKDLAVGASTMAAPQGKPVQEQVQNARDAEEKGTK